MCLLCNDMCCLCFLYHLLKVGMDFVFLRVVVDSLFLVVVIKIVILSILHPYKGWWHLGHLQYLADFLRYRVDTTLNKMSGEENCSINLEKFLKSIQVLAAAVHYSLLEIDCFESMGRPGRPKRDTHPGFKVDKKIRIAELHRLRKEVQEDSAQLTSMLNLVLRPDRPSHCYCGGCQASPILIKKELKLTEQSEPKKQLTLWCGSMICRNSYLRLKL
ncbi:uncharacterized protein LOC122504127 [Leptopilina heterotoma]|uniref:uncharacterized protein LOC122504127 n=1 Tax=Leptopilina heterotoma TaxID=63436 RepID=UPI001CA8DBBA|nr:uncharacterized protein LOC122504127 [Leptopilina heterotoma]